MLKRIIRTLRTLGSIATKPQQLSIRKAFPDGHFYSPIFDTTLLEKEVERIWPVDPEVNGIDFNEDEQLRWITEILPKHLPFFDYPETVNQLDAADTFYQCNTQFGGLDARMLFAFLRETSPRRLIEVGSGFSSLLTADVNQRFLEGCMDFTCIEPYPRNFLRNSVSGISRLLESRVQDVPLETFDVLDEGDVLFIDSSHVVKTGSDVNYLFLQVLPRLKSGVVIHIHDIFLPQDYPKKWVLGEGRGWSEQYLVHALLMYSSGFKVLFGSAYCQIRLRSEMMQALNGRNWGGGSLWLRKVQ